MAPAELPSGIPCGTVRRGAGFSMVELIVVMIIVGVLAAVATPLLSLMRGFDEVGFRDAVIAALGYARKSAVAQRRNVCVQTSGNVLTLTIESVTPEASPAAPAQNCSSGLPANAYARALNLPAADAECAAANQVCAAGVALAQDGLPNGSLSFSPLGVPSAGATFTVTGTNTATITVEAETGYVR